MHLPQDDNRDKSSYYPYTTFKKFADFAAEKETTSEDVSDALLKHQAEIIDAPKTFCGHTIVFFFYPTNQQQYNQFLEGLEHAFGKEVIKTTIPLDKRMIQNETRSLPAILLAHSINAAIETVRPIINEQLGTLRVQASIPDTEEQHPPSTGLLAKAIKKPLIEIIQNAKGIVNTELKDAHIKLEIEEPLPSNDHPLCREKIKNSIEESYYLFKTYVTNLSQASSAAQCIQNEFQELQRGASFPFINDELNGIPISLQEKVSASNEIAASMKDYASNVEQELRLNIVYESNNDLTILLDESAQNVASTLRILPKTFIEVEKNVKQLIQLQQSPDIELSGFKRKNFVTQQQELSNHIQTILLKSTEIMRTTLEIVDQLKQQLPHHEEGQKETTLLGTDQLGDLKIKLSTQLDAFKESANVLNQLYQTFIDEKTNVLKEVNLAVEEAGKEFNKQPLYGGFDTFAKRSLQRTQNKNTQDALAKNKKQQEAVMRILKTEG